MTQHTPKERLIRFPEVMKRTSKSRAGIYAAINRGDFPKSVKLGPKSVAFIESEIDAWIADLMASGRESETSQ
jgi:prophage regulatory protein